MPTPPGRPVSSFRAPPHPTPGPQGWPPPARAPGGLKLVDRQRAEEGKAGRAQVWRVVVLLTCCSAFSAFLVGVALALTVWGGRS